MNADNFFFSFQFFANQGDVSDKELLDYCIATCSGQNNDFLKSTMKNIQETLKMEKEELDLLTAPMHEEARKRRSVLDDFANIINIGISQRNQQDVKPIVEIAQNFIQ